MKYLNYALLILVVVTALGCKDEDAVVINKAVEATAISSEEVADDTGGQL